MTVAYVTLGLGYITSGAKREFEAQQYSMYAFTYGTIIEKNIKTVGFIFSLYISAASRIPSYTKHFHLKM